MSASTSTSNQIIISKNKDYYTYQGNKYDIRFPITWAIDQLPETGHECSRCLAFGSFRGVLFGYCNDCNKPPYYPDLHVGSNYNGTRPAVCSIPYKPVGSTDHLYKEDDDIVYKFPSKKYYIYRGRKYHTDFPLEWAKNQKPETGHTCANCMGSGSFRDVLIGYCINCIEFVYTDEDRGNGFDGDLDGLENVFMLMEPSYVPKDCNETIKEVAPYLKDDFNVTAINSLD
jgi:hypothetical protein